MIVLLHEREMHNSHLFIDHLDVVGHEHTQAQLHFFFIINSLSYFSLLLSLCVFVACVTNKPIFTVQTSLQLVAGLA